MAFLAITIATLLFASCSETTNQLPTKKDFSVSVKKDTSIITYIPRTAPRYSCNGTLLKEPKYTGDTEGHKSISVNADTTVSAEQMQKLGWYWFAPGSTPALSTAHFNWFPDWLRWLLERVFWVIALLLAGWLLWEVVAAIARNASSAERVKTSGGNQSSAKSETTETETSSTNKINAVTALVETVGKSGGGTVTMEGIFIEINGVSAPLINIENNGSGSHMGNVEIHIGDKTAVDPK